MESTIDKKQRREWIFPLFASVLSSMAFVNILGLTTTNIFSLLLILLMYQMYKISAKITDKKITVASSLCGMFYSGAYILVHLFDYIDIGKIWSSTILNIIYSVGLYMFFRCLTAFLFNCLMNADLSGNDRKKRNVTRPALFIFFIIGVLLTILAWMPYFLRNYPGDLTQDSFDQLDQILGSAPLSNHHPVAHTMMIKLFYSIGMAIFNDQTKAVATYSICQQILLAASFSYLLTTMYKFFVRRSVIFIVFAFYAFVPYNALYSITMWKDILFGGFVVVLSTTIWRLFRHFSEGRTTAPIFESVMILISGIGICLFRSNGLYAYILLLPFLVFIFIKKSKLPSIMAAVALAVSLIVKGPVYNSMGVLPPDPIESLSIPAQHIAYLIKDHGPEYLTDEQYELLSNIVDVEAVSSTYRSYISDPIKNLVRKTGNQEYLTEHKREFLKLWITLGLKNPAMYLIAHSAQTYGYWYPDVQYWVYAAVPDEDFIKGDGYCLTKQNMLPEKLDTALTGMINSYIRIPYYGLVWSIGTATWICVFVFGLCYIRQRKSYLIIYIPVLAVLATLMIATPVYAEFRYAYCMFTTLPLLCVVPFCSFERDNTHVSPVPIEPDDNSPAAEDITDTESQETPPIE